MKYYQTTTEFNCGIDLHTRQMYICVMNRAGEVLVHRNIRDNDFDFFLKLVEPYRHDLTVTCESCFVCFWLADACEDAGINFVLAHAYYVKSIAANKHKNDKEDSRELVYVLFCCHVSSVLGQISGASSRASGAERSRTWGLVPLEPSAQYRAQERVLGLQPQTPRSPRSSAPPPSLG